MGRPPSRWDAIDRYFEITRRGSTLGTEVRGGCVTFVTISYILPVNARILTAWAIGAPDGLHTALLENMATATALTCGVGCILVGFLSGMPFAIGPGMGLNTFAASLYVHACTATTCNVKGSEEIVSLVTTTVFFLGALVTVLSLANATQLVLLVLPSTLKTAIMVGIGALQAFIGFRWMKVIRPDEQGIVKLECIFGAGGLDFDFASRGDPASGWSQLLFFFCLMLMSILFRRGVKGSILIGIAVTTLLSWLFGVGGGEAVLPFDWPSLGVTADRMNFAGWFSPSSLATYAPELATMFLITVFDVGGVLFGIAKAVDLPKARQVVLPAAGDQESATVEDTELLPGRAGQMAYACVGLSSMMSAMLGCSPCIIFLECAAGVQEGSRTGLSSMVTGVLFLFSSFFVPLFRNVPVCASASALVFVGCLMMGSVGEIQWNDLNHALPAFLCILMMPFTASITPGIMLGLATYAVMALGSPQELLARWHSAEDGGNNDYRKLDSPHVAVEQVTPGSGNTTESCRGTRSVSKLSRKASGAWDIVEEMVPDTSSQLSPMDILCKTTQQFSSPKDSVVTSALIGVPR
mmetsp:Transcript_124495/g.265374  ORF Transcript_124495/g.265374 Transcript_124495/m.265374 type:complete len:580 (-) Transcript_124495:187-1926(-)